MRKSAWLALLLVAGFTCAETLAVAAPLPSQSTQQSTQSSGSTQGTAQSNASAAPNNGTSNGQSVTPETQEPTLAPRPAETPNARGREVPAGTNIEATLDTRLSTQVNKVGDRFTATVNQPVNASDGTLAIPAGARIVGEVTEIEQGKTLGTLTGNKARLNMRFTEVQLPNGSTVPLAATLASVHNTSKSSGAKTGNEGEVQGGTTGTRTAKDVGIGAGLGTIAGLIFGSALKGLAIGAIAGGGYVLATGGKEVVLPEQTGLELRVDHALAVPASAAPGQ